MNKTEKYFEDILKDLEENRKSTQEALDVARTKKMVKCHGCGRRTKVSKLTYIQTRWYTPAFGCTGGDYWQDGEGQFDCPKCGKNNRLYERPDVEALKPFFKDVVKKNK